MKKLNIMVLMGGPSLEHDISMKSGTQVVKNLDVKKYNVFPVIISKDGKSWSVADKNLFIKNYGINKIKQLSPKANVFSLTNSSFFKKIQVCFIALHGNYGEDGRIQGVLEYLNIPYTGSNVLASAIGMNKLISRQIFIQNGINVPKTVVYTDKNEYKNIKYPVVVKPNDQGSSIGVYICKNGKEFSTAILELKKMSPTILIEEFIKGTELTCAVLGNKKPYALPVIEIVSKNEFFDYSAKYSASLSNEIVPARISKVNAERAKKAALAAYKAIAARGFGRIDMILKNDKVYVLEINTIPGMTTASLLPKAASASGKSFTKLLDEIISYALEK